MVNVDSTDVTANQWARFIRIDDDSGNDLVSFGWKADESVLKWAMNLRNGSNRVWYYSEAATRKEPPV
jgi:hypothetical protein